MISPSISSSPLSEPPGGDRSGLESRQRALSPFRWRLVVYGLVLAVLLGRIAWQRSHAASLLSQAHGALDRDDLSGAIDVLKRLDDKWPGRADVQYLLAVAQRRSGVLDVSLRQLRRAERLGYAAGSIRRQRLLADF